MSNSKTKKYWKYFLYFLASILLIFVTVNIFSITSSYFRIYEQTRPREAEGYAYFIKDHGARYDDQGKLALFKLEGVDLYLIRTYLYGLDNPEVFRDVFVVYHRDEGVALPEQKCSIVKQGCGIKQDIEISQEQIKYTLYYDMRDWNVVIPKDRIEGQNKEQFQELVGDYVIRDEKFGYL